jgi:hypothetical protein
LSDNNTDNDTEYAALLAEMRAWRAGPVPTPAPVEPMTEETARLLGCDTPEGLARYRRLSAWRDAGYTGPLDEHDNIPDPDDPVNAAHLRTLAALRKANR